MEVTTEKNQNMLQPMRHYFGTKKTKKIGKIEERWYWACHGHTFTNTDITLNNESKKMNCERQAFLRRAQEKSLVCNKYQCQSFPATIINISGAP